MIDKQVFSDLLSEQTERYIHLRIAGVSVRTPYYINNPLNLFFNVLAQKLPQDTFTQVKALDRAGELPLAMHKGKGTPEQLEADIEKLLSMLGRDLSHYDEEGIRLFMRMYGLGVDCSGFVFNVLEYALSKVLNQPNSYEKSLIGITENRGVFRASAALQSNDQNTVLVSDIQTVQPGDIIFISGKDQEHVMLVIRNNISEGTLDIAESSFSRVPNGVSLGTIRVTDPKGAISDQEFITDRYWRIQSDRLDSNSTVRRPNILVNAFEG